jgi:hypothetical protein
VAGKSACGPVGRFRKSQVGPGAEHLRHGVGARARSSRSSGVRAIAVAPASASAPLPWSVRSRRLCGVRMWKGSRRPSGREAALPAGRRRRDLPGLGRGRSHGPGGAETPAPLRDVEIVVADVAAFRVPDELTTSVPRTTPSTLRTPISERFPALPPFVAGEVRRFRPPPAAYPAGRARRRLPRPARPRGSQRPVVPSSAPAVSAPVEPVLGQHARALRVHRRRG